MPMTCIVRLVIPCGATRAPRRGARARRRDATYTRRTCHGAGRCMPPRNPVRGAARARIPRVLRTAARGCPCHGRHGCAPPRIERPPTGTSHANPITLQRVASHAGRGTARARHADPRSCVSCAFASEGTCRRRGAATELRGARKCGGLSLNHPDREILRRGAPGSRSSCPAGRLRGLGSLPFLGVPSPAAAGCGAPCGHSEVATRVNTVCDTLSLRLTAPDLLSRAPFIEGRADA